MVTEIVIPCIDLDEALRFFTDRLDFRLEMILPADEPSIAVVSARGVRIRLEKSGRAESHVQESSVMLASRTEPGPAHPEVRDLISEGIDVAVAPIISRSDEARWIIGRAGMEYRDLIPGRLKGRLSASLIRLAAGGEVPDYVHYHKVRFQMIYCWHGRVRVVYEDQGDPFWLHPGDCVLQPPEIRHRVLESAANTMVVELTSPAVHETWTDHDVVLPTGRLLPDRDFGGQRFVYHKASESTPVLEEFGEFESHHFGVGAATGGVVGVFELRSRGDYSSYEADASNRRNTFLFLLTGRATVAFEHRTDEKMTPGDSVLIPPLTAYGLDAPANAEILCVNI